MDANIEKELTLPGLSVHLGTISWNGTTVTPPYPGYCLSQRLSKHHAPLRIGNLMAPSVLPRVRSVGLLPPEQSVRMLPVESPLRVVCCIFDKDFFEEITEVPQQHWDRYVDSLVSIKNSRLETLMQEIYAELQEPGFGSELLIEASGLMIAVELARYMRELGRQSTRERKHQPVASWQMRRIHERLEAALTQGYPSVAELAELCGISQGHLARSFKAATGWPIHQFIAEERLKTAKALLTHESLSCAEVARALGFNSTAYFSTAFRRMTGKSPTQFRQKALSPRT